MKARIVCYPHDSIERIAVVADAAERLGYHAFYLTDSNYRRDPWVLLGMLAPRTERIRLGPDVARLRVTDPLVVARALATLDELSNGRAEGGLGLGYAASLRAVSKDVAGHAAPIAYLREAFQVIRQALSEPKIEFEGKYVRYRITDVPMMWQTVQRPLPLFYGSGGGPKAIELAAEVLDGLHLSGYKRALIEFGLHHVKVGAARAGRDWRSLDLATTITTVCSEDRDSARRVARIWSSYFLGRTAPQGPIGKEFTERGFTTDLLNSISDRWAAGDIKGAIDQIPYELAALSIVAGTPDEVLTQLRDNLAGTGVDHLVFSFADESNVRMLIGAAAAAEVRIPSAAQQAALIQTEVLPRLNDV